MVPVHFQRTFFLKRGHQRGGNLCELNYFLPIVSIKILPVIVTSSHPSHSEFGSSSQDTESFSVGYRVLFIACYFASVGVLFWCESFLGHHQS